MKKILAILCLAAFTSSAIAAPIATAFSQENAIVAKLDKDKDKDKKKKKDKSCCSKEEAKSCGEGAKTNGAAATGSGNGAVSAPKSCCSKDAAKSCSKDSKNVTPAK